MVSEILLVAAVVLAMLGLLGLFLVIRQRRIDPGGFGRKMLEADRALATGQVGEARQRYRRVAEEIRAMPEAAPQLMALRGEALLAIGEIDRTDGRLDDALEAYRRAIALVDAPLEILRLVAEDSVRREDITPEAVHVYARYVSKMRGCPRGPDPVMVFLEARCKVDASATEDELNRIIPLAEQLITADPDLEWVHFNLGLAYSQLGRTSEAITSFLRAGALSPDRPEAPFNLGLLYLAQGETGRAYQALTRSLNIDAQQPEALYQISRILLSRARRDDAGAQQALADGVTALRRACALAPQQARYWYLLGQAEMLRKQPEQAKAALARAAALNPGKFSFQVAVAGVLRTLRDRSGAIEALRGAVRIDPKQIPARLQLAELLLEEGAPDEAEEHFRFVLTSDPRRDEAGLGIGRALYGQRRWAEAIVELEAIEGRGRAGNAILGKAYRRDGRAADAVALLSQWLRTHGPDIDVLLSLGIAHGQMNEWFLAVKAFERADAEARRRGRIRADVLFLQAIALTRQGWLDDATAAFETAAEADPRNPALRYAQGVLALERGAIDRAEAAFAAAVTIDPSFRAGHLALGAVREQTGDFAAAMQSYAAAFESMPGMPEAMLRSGVAAAKAGAWEQALVALTTAAEQGIANDEHRFYLGLAQARADRYREALATWEPLLERQPDDEALAVNVAAALYELGHHYLKAGAYAEAIGVWERAPDLPAFRSALGEAHLRLGAATLQSTSHEARAEARDLLERSRRFLPDDPRPVFGLALVSLADGEPHGAVTELTPLVERYPDDTGYRYHLGMAHLAAGNARTALQVWETLPRELEEYGAELPLARGNALSQLGRWAEALDAYASAMRWAEAEYRHGAVPAWIPIALRQALACAQRADRLVDAAEVIAPWTEIPPTRSAAQYAMGLIAAQQGDARKAVALLEPFLETAGTEELNTFVARLRLEVGRRAATTGDFATAAAEVGAAFRLAPGLAEVRKLLPLVEEWSTVALIGSGQLEEAAAAWEMALQHRPTDPSLIHHLAILYYRLATQPGPDQENWWRKAIAHWATTLHSAAFLDGWRRRRQAATGLEYSTEDVSEARRVMEEHFLRELRNAAGNAPESALHTLEVAWELECRTAAHMAEWVTATPVPGWPAKFGVGPFMLARLQTTTNGRPAVAALCQALARAEGDSARRLRHYLSRLGQAYFLIENHRLDQAIQKLEQAEDIPEASDLLRQALLVQGEELIRAERWAEGLEMLKQARLRGADLSKQGPVVAEACVQRSREILGAPDPDYDRAIEALELGIDLAGERRSILAALGAVYSQRAIPQNNAKQYEAAVASIRTALKYTPDDVHTRHYARVTLTNLANGVIERDPETAVSLMKEGLSHEQDPEGWAALSTMLFQYAVALARANQRERAIAATLEGIRVDPTGALAATQEEARGLLKRMILFNASELAQQGEIGRAIAMAHEARSYEDGQDVRQATTHLKALEKALSSNNVPAQRSALVDLFFTVGRFEEAIPLLEETLADSPGNRQAQYSLQVAVHNRGLECMNRERYDEAIVFLRRSLQLSDQVNTREALASCLALRGARRRARGELDAATTDLEEAMRYDPYNPDLVGLV